MTRKLNIVQLEMCHLHERRVFIKLDTSFVLSLKLSVSWLRMQNNPRKVGNNNNNNNKIFKKSQHEICGKNSPERSRRVILASSKTMILNDKRVI